MKSVEKYDLIYSVVMSIPGGTVATYGQVAAIAGLAGRARQVGYALRCLPDDSGVPWHRVVNAKGEISRRGSPGSEFEQRALLEEEGIVFNKRNRLPLEQYQWER